MTLVRKITAPLRRALDAFVDANLRYARAVHGSRAVADGDLERSRNAPRPANDASRRAA